MFDAIVLPALFFLVILFLAYIWLAWLSDKSGRALAFRDDERDE